MYRSTIYGFTVNTATDTPIAQPTTNSYSNTGLTASTTYYYRVAAVNNAGSIGILQHKYMVILYPPQGTGQHAVVLDGVVTVTSMQELLQVYKLVRQQALKHRTSIWVKYHQIPSPIQVLL